MATFAVDSKTENWLNRMGVRWTYHEGLRFDDLVDDWCVVNHGRPDGVPKDDALIEKYAASQIGGAVFPAPILAKKSTKFEVLDGCQRLSASFLNDHTLFSGYEVHTTSPSIRASIRICANAVVNGTSPSADWTVTRVVDVLHEVHRMSVVDCEMWSGVPAARIQCEIDSRDARRWMESHNIDVTKKPANQKGFQAAIAAIPKKLRDEAPGQIRAIVESCQAIKANNSEAVNLINECTDIKPKHGVHPRTQLTSKTQEVFSRPEIKSRMQVKASQHPVDNAIRAMTGALTALRNAQSYHADFAQANSMIELLAECRQFCKKIVPRGQWPIAETTTR